MHVRGLWLLNEILSAIMRILFILVLFGAIYMAVTGELATAWEIINGTCD